jgi:hypothetical protein
MIRQNESVLSFLLKPVSEHSTLGPVETVLKRYAIRHDLEPNSVQNLKQLFTDLSGSVHIQQEIEECLEKKGKSNLKELKSQVLGLIDLYKSVGEKLLECESKMMLRLEKMDNLQKRVTTVMELQSNEALPAVTSSLERYLEVSFRDLNIETQYKQLLSLYQKHIALRDAIQMFRTTDQALSEPLCPICLQDSVTTGMSPCGHTFCNGCSKRMILECYVCRQKIRERLKLFFS